MPPAIASSHGALCHLHIGSDVDSLNINVDPCVRDGAFAFDAHWSADDFDLGELAEWNLRAGGSRDDDLLEGLEVFAEIAVVSQVYGVAFESLDRGRERHASEGDFQHVLHVADTQAVAGNLIAVDQELDVVATHDALGEDAAGIRHLADDSLDLCCDTFERGRGPGRRL